jgi:hypothetical protein
MSRGCEVEIVHIKGRLLRKLFNSLNHNTRLAFTKISVVPSDGAATPAPLFFPKVRADSAMYQGGLFIPTYLLGDERDEDDLP